MKNSIVRWMFAAAAVTAIAGVASAEAVYKAEIPLAFQAGGMRMAPGAYRIYVNTQAGANVIQLRNLDNHTGAFLLPYPGSPPKGWKDAGEAVMTFECYDGACALRGLWDGAGSVGYGFLAHKPGPDDAAVLRTIRVTLTPVK